MNLPTIYITSDIDNALDWISRKKQQYCVTHCDIVPKEAPDGTTRFQAEIITGGDQQ